MESTNNIDLDNGNSTEKQESLPTTTSVLDKSRSLFGNPTAARSTPVQEQAPDASEKEPAIKSSVSMETDEIAVSNERGEGKTPEASPAEVTETAETQKSQLVEMPESSEQNEETFEKKLVSMDTSKASSASPETAAEAMELDEKDEKSGSKINIDDVQEEEDNEDEEEEEIPKKKAKRTASTSDDDDVEDLQIDESPASGETEESESGEKMDESEVAGEEKAIDSAEVEKEIESAEGNDNAESLEDSDTVEAAEVDKQVKSAEDTKNDESAEDKITEATGECSEHPQSSTPVSDTLGENSSPSATNNTTAESEPNDGEETTSNTSSIDKEASEQLIEKKESPAENGTGEESREADETGEDNAAAEVDKVTTEDEADIETAGNDVGDIEEQQTPEQVQEPKSSNRSSRGRKAQSAVATPSTSDTPKRGRGRQSNVGGEDGSSSTKVETPRRGRSTRAAQNKEVTDDIPEHAEDDSMVAEKRGARRSVVTKNKQEDVADVIENSPAPEETSEEPTEEAPKRGGRGRRSVAASSVATTPRSARGRAKKSQLNEDVDQGQEDTHEEVGESSTKKRSRTPRTRKSSSKTEVVDEANGDVQIEESSAPNSSRRSTRTKIATNSTPAVVETKRTPARGRKKNVSISEEAAEDSAETPVTRKGRGPTKNVPSSSKKNDEFDPYDMDTEMEHHPEPLKNIHMEVQNFGAVKYAKSGQSESKYSMTEKAAESRIAELQTSPTSKNKRSLADMTPGREKQKQRASTGTGRRPRAKKEENVNDVDMQDVSRDGSSEAPSSTNRGRKRKSEGSQMTSPLAKREPQVTLKSLSSEEQLLADHPQDDNDSHAPGARVYAQFDKIFYPAVILNERDGLGRYKLQFTTDKVVKAVPNSGIIPLRVLTAGKTAIYEEQDARLDVCPNDISAEEWAKGRCTITLLDDDGEPTENTKVVDWNELSFDTNEFRDYVKSLNQSATAVVTSNITSVSQGSRSRKVLYTTEQRKPANRRKQGTNSRSSRAVSESLADDDDDKILPMKEEAIGKNIFSGKLFMLTSANRTNSVNVPSMLKKKNLIEFIIQNGGTVTENHNIIPKSANMPILVSDTYYRTHKYLAALAQGIPCVRNIWLQACGEKGEFVDYEEFILPAGASIFDNEDMPAPKNPSELLKGKTIYIHSTHSAREITQTGPGGTFIEIWRPILELLGANVIEGFWETIISDETKFDVALVDGSFREEVMAYSDKIKASKVTSEWVIQTIILGRAPEPTAHNKFDPYRLHHRTRH